jgi:light-regulated signal transduction histidine kinase (bacteriophytochrome)
MEHYGSLLKSLGHQVYVAKSVMDALSLLQIRDFAAAIIDQRDTRENAIQAAEEIRAASRDTRVVFFEPFAGAEEIEQVHRSNDALREFCWALSHDLAQPIRGILLLSHYLQSASSKLDEKERRSLEFLTRSAEEMRELVESLLEYVRCDIDASEDLQPVNLNRVMQKVAARLQYVVNENGGAIEWDTLPTVFSSEVLVTRVLQNLVGNALKYRSTEPPKVAVRCESEGDCEIVSVQDNGIGIGADYLEYIFEPLKRLNRKDSAGAGLGLALCRSAVRRLGGRIWAESDGSSGSTFRFTVPRRSGASETKATGS